MSEASEEHPSSDEAVDDCSVATPNGGSGNEADEYKSTKLQAIRKRSAPSSKTDQKELKSKESITSERKISKGARFSRLDYPHDRPTSPVNRDQPDRSSQ